MHSVALLECGLSLVLLSGRLHGFFFLADIHNGLDFAPANRGPLSCHQLVSGSNVKE
jgi:hypothetical protein